MYEVTWQRYLATLLGSQGEATAAILAIFLGGLSLGYALFGRLTRRLVMRSQQRQTAPRLLLGSGAVEAVIGLYALCFPLLFGVAQKLSLLVPLETAGLAFACDVLLSALLIGPPTVLMGSTIPMLTLGLAGSRERASRIHALIYASNTAGAFAGALAAGFVLVPRLGLDGVLCAMGWLNIAAGFAFVVLDAFGARVVPDVEHAAAGRAPAVDRFSVYACVALLAGFAMMALQTTFNRIGALSFGASHFTFAMVVAVFVFCIALGSFAVSLFRRIPRSALVVSQWALVVLLFALYCGIEDATYWAHTVRMVFRDLSAAFIPYWFASFSCVLLALMLPIGLSGALLPLLFNQLRGEIGDLGSVAGRLYSWNTVGSLLGALFGGYLLLFWLDLHQIYRIALAALIVQAALLTALVYRASPGKLAAIATAPALLALLALPPWSPDRLSAGLFRRQVPQADDFVGPDKHFAGYSRGKVIFYDDGPSATVTVRDTTKRNEKLSLSIYLNGKSDGNTVSDYPTTSLLALIPALMVDELERCFVIGFGTGISTGELAALDWVREVEVAEMADGVIKAVPLFDAANLGVSKNPKVTIRRGDAYRTLMRSEGKYDLIVSEPSNPWVTGVEMLYSVEFLEAARAHLSAGGAYAQWMHLYSLDDATMELVLRSYTAVFPSVSVWVTQSHDLLLLGFNRPEPAVDLDEMAARFERADFAAGFGRAGVESLPALLARELAPVGVLPASQFTGPMHTLAHPRLSDMAARAFFRNDTALVPKFPTPEIAQIGFRNSLLRRYVGGERGPFPEEISEIAVRVMCTLERFTECAALLAAWVRAYPESQRRDALLEEPLIRRAVSTVITQPTLTVVESLFGGQPMRNLQGRRSLARATRVSDVYLSYYHFAVPFDRDVLRMAWDLCAAPACASARQEVERYVGTLGPATRDELSRRGAQRAVSEHAEGSPHAAP
ncbi:MAG TPA: hypothetical protein VEC18_02840 [Myxococcota bacterium]|nr:hypothetical protein [Myxococcota bacterium]